MAELVEFTNSTTPNCDTSVAAITIEESKDIKGTTRTSAEPTVKIEQDITTEKDTIMSTIAHASGSLRTNAYNTAGCNPFSSQVEDEGQLSQRLSNLTVSSTEDYGRSITPVPLQNRASPMTELSPATLNRLRSCGNTTSLTTSPCVTDITEVAANTTSFAAANSSGLRLPTLGMTGTCSNRESPSTSQVSVGSVPPTLTAALLPAMRQYYDLTPVTRNTSTSASDRAGASNLNEKNNTLMDRHITVTPSTDDYDLDDPFLHGEHLAMPSDFITGFPSDPIRAGSSSFPALQPSVMRVAPQGGGVASAIKHHDDGSDDDFNIPVPGHLPVEFPPRKFYSFTSRRHYEEEMEHQSRQGLHHTMKPYQPGSRQENFDIERVPQEELERIFIARRAPPARAQHPQVEDGRSNSNSTATDESDTHQNHRLLRATIPLDDEARQWSIPSIRMAHHLQGSTTSVTDTTEYEDEDSLVYIYTNNNNCNSNINNNIFTTNGLPVVAFQGFPGSGIEEVHGHDDNLSLSSRGSSLCLPEDFGAEGSYLRAPGLLNIPLPQHLPTGIPSDVYSDDTDSVEAVVLAGENNEPPYQAETSRHRKRKQQRQQEAFEWLQSVEVDQNVVAEAASSKFLTSGNNNYLNYPEEHPQQYLHHQLRRPLQTEGLTVVPDQHDRIAARRQSSPSVFLQRQSSSPSKFLTSNETTNENGDESAK